MAPPRPRRDRPIAKATAAGVTSPIFPAVSLLRQYLLTGSLVPLTYTFFISCVTFLVYGYDNRSARVLKWRVKETTLHMLELFGGWPGALAGQHYFQHKTKKAEFMLSFWVIVLGWQGVWWTIWNEGIRVP